MRRVIGSALVTLGAVILLVDIVIVYQVPLPPAPFSFGIYVDPKLAPICGAALFAVGVLVLGKKSRLKSSKQNS
jgi:hypothetical protein